MRSNATAVTFLVPQVSIAQTYLKIMNRFCEQFGLTPSSRSRIVSDNEVDVTDEMELLLFKGGVK
jgi:phage terminase small subunit